MFTSDLRICSSCPTYSTGIVPYRIAHLKLSSKRRTLWFLRIFVHVESRAMFPNDASYICSPQRYSTYIGSFRLAHLQQSTTLQCRHCSIPTCACAAGERVACLGSPGAVATDATAKAGVAALGPSDPRWFLWAFGVARCWPFGSARTLLSLGPPGPFCRPDVGRLLQFSHEHTQIKS